MFLLIYLYVSISYQRLPFMSFVNRFLLFLQCLFLWQRMAFCVLICWYKIDHLLMYTALRGRALLGFEVLFCPSAFRVNFNLLENTLCVRTTLYMYRYMYFSYAFLIVHKIYACTVGNTSSVRNLLMDEERMRPGIGWTVVEANSIGLP